MILASLSLLIQLITENIKNVVTVSAYQANLEAHFEAYQWFGVEEAPNLKEFLGKLV